MRQRIGQCLISPSMLIQNRGSSATSRRESVFTQQLESRFIKLSRKLGSENIDVIKSSETIFSKTRGFNGGYGC